MTQLRRHYLKSSVAIAGAVLVVVVLAVLPGRDGDELVSEDVPQNISAPAVIAGSSARSDGSSHVMALHESPQPVPELSFENGDGKAVTLADFRGKMVLLNVWATWCGPCRREMPTLDRLQVELGGPDFGVLALSIDRAGIGVVTEFYDEIGIQHLAKYIDDSGKAAQQLNALGLPTTLLIDREGREIARHVGPAEWDTPEMVAFFRRQLTGDIGTLGSEPEIEAVRAQANERTALSAPPRLLRPARLAPTPSATTEGNPS